MSFSEFTLEELQKQDLTKYSTQELKKALKEYSNNYSVYDTRQQAIKILLNSAYGAFGSIYFRWYDLKIAEAITTTGQAIVQTVIAHVNNWINMKAKTNDVDYTTSGDTDSAFFRLDTLVPKGLTDDEQLEFVKKLADEDIMSEIKSVIKKFTETYNHKSQILSMGREVIADHSIFVAKKKYAMNVRYDEDKKLDTPKLKIRGLEIVRSSTPRVIRKELEEAVKIALRGSQDDLIDYVETFRQTYNKLELDLIANSSSANNLTKYNLSDDNNPKWASKCPIHIKGAILYNHYIKKHGYLDKGYKLIENGEKIKYIYLIPQNPLLETILSVPSDYPKDLDLLNYIDYYTQYQKTFVNPLTSITGVMDWEIKKVPKLPDEDFPIA